MENKKENNITKGNGLGCAVIFLIIVLIIFVPVISNTLQEQENITKENNLIKEGKTVSAQIVIEEIVQILKDRNEEELKKYLTDDFSYWDNNRNESKYTTSFWRELKYLVEDNYDIEKRGNSIKDEETYYIYWNTNELVKERADRYYCLQKISIYLRRIVETDKITYKVYKIILTNN